MAQRTTSKTRSAKPSAQYSHTFINLRPIVLVPLVLCLVFSLGYFSYLHNHQMHQIDANAHTSLKPPLSKPLHANNTPNQTSSLSPETVNTSAPASSQTADAASQMLDTTHTASPQPTVSSNNTQALQGTTSLNNASYNLNISDSTAKVQANTSVNLPLVLPNIKP